jgi:hypothetical protein
VRASFDAHGALAAARAEAPIGITERAALPRRKPTEEAVMDGDFWYHMGFMTLTFGAFLLPALGSRRMERSDYVTLIGVVVATFLGAIVPAIAMFGFDKNSATYVLGGLIVIVVGAVNLRFPARAASASN